jgi:hypothetical protein
MCSAFIVGGANVKGKEQNIRSLKYLKKIIVIAKLFQFQVLGPSKQSATPALKGLQN